MTQKIVEDTAARRSSSRLASSSVLEVGESTELRRSTRDTSSNKIVSPEHPRTRKSERLEKQTPPAPSVKKNRVKKRLLESPLRRSERCKKHRPSLDPSVSKNSKQNSRTSVSHSGIKKEGKKENSTMKSSEKAKDASIVGRDDTKSIKTTKGRMNVHAYKALFREQKKPKLSGNAHSSSLKIDVNRQSRTIVLAIGNIKACPIHSEECSSPRKFPTQDCTTSGSHSSRIREKLSLAEQLKPGNASNLDSSAIHNMKSLQSPGQRVSSANNDIRSSEENSPVDVLLGRVDSMTNAMPSVGDGCTNMSPEVVVEVSAMINYKENAPAPSPSSGRGNFFVEEGGFNLKSASGELEAGLHSKVESAYRVESSRFVEYWVPVHLSNIQLEQYCATLLSNSLSLRSSSKNDPVGALRDILFASRKCCDHPYLVDSSLQKLLIKDLEVTQYLDVGINASGKLHLLDKMLSELRSRGLRALIMFQSIGSFGRENITIGDILDDFLRQRFGPESYERIDGDVPRHKKVAAMNNYNNKDKGRFIFLIEARACLPSIKLEAVDLVIIFGSDWNPSNDIRSLQRVQLESSQFERINIFRLYTSCTVEEKLLINARNGESTTIQNIQPISSHSLLIWGAKHLFDELKEFHHRGSPSSSLTTSSLDQSHSKDVLPELLSLLPEKDGKRSPDESSSLFLISRAQQGSQTYYTKSIPLLGESKIQTQPEELPHVFWTKLLDGKAPDWKYSSVSQQRNRKRVQINEDRHLEQNASNEVGKKRRKVSENNVALPSKKQGLDEQKLAAAANKKAASGAVHVLSQEKGVAVASEGNIIGSDEQRTLRDVQSRLHLMLKPQISRLCRALSLEGEVRDMVYTFLEYVINNFVVNQEPATIVQAFQLALCWTAASLVKLKIDHKESFALAKERLNYGCSKDEAECIYAILRDLKKPFLRQIESSEVVHNSKAAEKVNEIPVEEFNSNFSQHAEIFPNIIKVEIEDWPMNQESSDRDVIASPTLADRDISISFSIQEIQEEEKNEICRRFEAEKRVLEDEQRMEAFFITQLHRDGPLRAEKLKALENEYAGKIRECENQMNLRLKELEEAQIAARNEGQQNEIRRPVGVMHQDQLDCVDSITDGHGESERALSVEAAGVNEASGPITCAEPVLGDTYRNENFGTCIVLEQCVDTGSLEDVRDADLCVNPSSEENIPDRITTPAVQDHEPSQGQIAEVAITAIVQSSENNQSCEGGTEIAGDTMRMTIADEENGENEDNRGVRLLPTSEQVPDDVDKSASEDGLDNVENAPQHCEDSHDGQSLEAGGNVPDGVTACKTTSEQREDGISLLVVENVTSEDGAVMPSNQELTSQRPPSSIQEENPSQQTNDMPHDDSITAQPSDRPVQPDTEVPDAEMAVQVPDPVSNLETADVAPHQRSEEEGFNTQNTPVQSGPQPSMTATALQMASPTHSALENSSHTRRPSLSAQIALPKYSDPLQNELERLQLESDLTAKIHEDTQSKLLADCEMEIAQIRMKYDMKIRETEKEYLAKKSELLSIRNQVLMNKFLAEAFRSKCVDIRASAAHVVQQDAMLSYAQQLLTPSQHPQPNQNPNLHLSPTFIMRPSSSTLPQSNYRPPTFSHHPILNSQSLQPMGPPPPARGPPLIRQFSSPSVVQNIHPEPRAPTAPHIHHPMRPYPPNLTPRPGQSSGAHHPMAHLNARGSALELLRDIGVRALANQQQGSSFQLPSMNLPVKENPPGGVMASPSTGNNSATEVVCLSDED